MTPEHKRLIGCLIVIGVMALGAIAIVVWGFLVATGPRM